MEKCPECGGKGYKLLESHPIKPYGFLETTQEKWICYTCNGRGYKEDIPTGTGVM